jgi:general secretion pathway protein K
MTCSTFANSRKRPTGDPREGAVLIVVLWVLIVMSLLVGTLAFEMQVEANVTSYYRKRFKAQYMAKAGVEWARMMLTQANTLSQEEMEETYPELFMYSQHMMRGLAVHDVTGELGGGAFTLDLVPEQGRRNVNLLTEDDWRELLDIGQVPPERWDELIDTFFDWVDADDLHRLSGAESDDEFYEERGYQVKNARLDTVDELLMIKGFSRAIVYGGPGETDEDPPLLGIAADLTVYGDGRVNVNNASPEVLLTLPEIDEWMVEAILEGRAGLDGEFDTVDDGFGSVDEVLTLTGLDSRVAGRLTTTDRQFIRVTSIGEYEGVESGIWCIFRQDGQDLVPVYWREEQMQ